jgi:hypothetical protein
MVQAAPSPPTALRHLGKGLFAIAFLSGLVCAGIAYIGQKVIALPSPQIIFTPRRALPAYYQIKEADLEPKLVFIDPPDQNIIKESERLLGHYTLSEVPKYQPLRPDQIGPVVDASYLSNIATIDILATEAMTMNRKMLAGDVVDIVLSHAPTNKQTEPNQVTFKNILVLDVKPSKENQTSQGEVGKYRIILAMPLDRRLEFAVRMDNASLDIKPKSPS